MEDQTSLTNHKQHLKLLNGTRLHEETESHRTRTDIGPFWWILSKK